MLFFEHLPLQAQSFIPAPGAHHFKTSVLLGRILEVCLIVRGPDWFLLTLRMLVDIHRWRTFSLSNGQASEFRG